MAQVCDLAALDGSQCLDPTGGWLYADICEFSDVSSVTYDGTDTSLITAIALTSPAVFLRITPAAADGTTYAVESPDRDNQVSAPVLYNTVLAAQLKGFTPAQRKVLAGYENCCALVAKVQLNSGEIVVLGLEKDGTGFKKPIVPLFMANQNVKGGSYTGAINNMVTFKTTHKAAPMFFEV